MAYFSMLNAYGELDYYGANCMCYLRNIIICIIGEVLVEKLFCSFINPLISLYIYYMISVKKIWRIFFFPRFVSMEMAAIFDFRALTKVHITVKPLLQMQ